MSTYGGSTEIPLLDSLISNAVTPGSDVSTALSPEDREDISLLFLKVSRGACASFHSLKHTIVYTPFTFTFLVGQLIISKMKLSLFACSPLSIIELRNPNNRIQ
jgi:hypothetical protein